MQNITTSFFGLVKNNNGLYKSEKQAAFLSKFFDGGVYVTRQSLTFGEYEGRTNRNTATVEWTFYADALGITKVEKTTSKGTTTHWERLSAEAFAVKVESDKAKKVAREAKEAESMAKFQAKVDAFESAKAIARKCVKTSMLLAGSNEERAERASITIINNQSDIEELMSDLSKFPEFVDAWNAYIGHE